MKQKVVSIRFESGFYQKLREAHPENLSAYIRRLVEKEAFRSHKPKEGSNNNGQPS